jgi:hypothetical protein
LNNNFNERFNFYSNYSNPDTSPSIITMTKSRMMKWVGHVKRMEKRNAYRILVGKPEVKRPLGRQRSKCVDYIKMDLREIGWGGTEWIELAQDKGKWTILVNTVISI